MQRYNVYIYVVPLKYTLMEGGGGRIKYKHGSDDLYFTDYTHLLNVLALKV